MGKENPEANRAQPKFQKKIELEGREAGVADRGEVRRASAGCTRTGCRWTSRTSRSPTRTANFKITDLPPGDYEVEIWQGELGKKTEKVTIKAKEDTKVGWSMGKS